MDIDIVISELQAMLVDAQSYASHDAEKTAINGATTGVLTVNSKPLVVEGTEFTALLDVELSSLSTTLTTITTRLQSAVIELATEIG
tara:strand:- start:843 stop:1103 length:261 start_codon:yes stop_codon:yes gene_type:complete